MAQSASLSLPQLTHLPQHTLKVEVHYYDSEQQNLLEQFPNAAQIESIAGQELEIPIAEFLTYYLFHRKRAAIPGDRNFIELGRKIQLALSDLEGFVEFDGESLRATLHGLEQRPEVTERIGESIGLSIVNRIHGLTDADWNKIPTGAIKTLDFEWASDGQRLIEVETKGSCIPDNDARSNSIYQHKASIVKKKDVQRQATRSNDPAVRYGTITVIGTRSGQLPKCLLLDPEPSGLFDSPSKRRLINRMQFLHEWISFAKPRSQLTAALAMRISDLNASSNPFEFDAFPLVDGSGRPFEFEAFNSFRPDELSFFSNNSRVKDGAAGGMVFRISREYLFFLGFHQELVFLATDQKFQGLLKYLRPSETLTKTVECILSASAFGQFQIAQSSLRRFRERTGSVRFELDGDLHYSPEGLVFGILPLPKAGNKYRN